MGAFGSAIDGLISRGLYEPLREYLASGKPYFGICIGMQVLFRSSLESPSSKGLGIIPSGIGLFSNADKSVPHMGWNSVEFLDPEEKAHKGLDPGSTYYFVHSFRAAYDWERPEVAQWAHTTTQYGQEVFLATVRKGNVFACQFHPEKSGPAGLKVLDAWLRQSEVERATSPPTPRVARPPHHPRPSVVFPLLSHHLHAESLSPLHPHRSHFPHRVAWMSIWTPRFHSRRPHHLPRRLFQQ